VTYVYQADAEDCRAGPARSQCCPELSLNSGGRTASVQVYDPAIERFDEKDETARGAQDLQTTSALIKKLSRDRVVSNIAPEWSLR